jgi:bifunctional non-homologous end joining protein LigD
VRSDRASPLLVARPPAGSGWLHEVKHDGYRIISLKQGERVTLWTRYGADFTNRLPRIAEAIRGLPAENALIDGEAVAHASPLTTAFFLSTCRR